MMQHNGHVLVVEDEPSMQTLLRHTFSRAGYDVTVTPNAIEALEFLESGGTDIICSDVMMSGMDGITFCRHVKQNDGLRKIPFILLSSRAQRGDRELGLEAGADAYMTKPFDLLELAATVGRLLKPG